MQIKDLPASAAVNAADVFAKDTNASITNKITAQNLADGLMSLSGGLPASSAAIIIEGNKTTHATGAAIGDYVYVLNSTIANRPDGLYKAAQAIPYNTPIDYNFLTPLPNGGYNALNADLASLNSQVAINEVQHNIRDLLIYKMGNIVFLRSIGNGPPVNTIPAGKQYPTLVLPDSVRPTSGSVSGSCSYYDGGWKLGWFTISEEDGGLMVRSGSNPISTTYAAFSVCYYI